MATQTLNAHAGHAHSSSTSSYPPRPASPTLTNPDMILPDYDRSPSPDRSHSPLTMWKNSHAVDMNMQFQFPPSAYIAGPITPTTPIIYGNGTMLSDIGEVTEAESTPGRRSRPTSVIWSRPNNRSGDDSRQPQSPTKMLESLKKRAAQATRSRRSSVESTSTITTTQDQNAMFADFDDTVSVDDSNFQGDDEESVAESYAEDVSVHQAHAIHQPPRESLDDPNRYSTALISRRAEQILANAKRRLTTMEGNLSRARSSLSISTPSMSSFDGNNSTPSPTILRPASSAASPTSIHGHARMLSDTSLNYDAGNNGTIPRRSASAMGAAGGYRQPYSVRKNVHDATLERLNSGGEGQSRYKAAQEIGLEPLGEDEVAQEFHSGSDSTKRESLLSPALSSSSRDRPLVRSASVAQMRDLKGQVQDLKGKISSLREQARADTMRRRSLQSLRTPSPFTHAQVDQWYAKSQEEQSPPLTATSDKNPWNADAVSVDGLVQERGFPSDVLVELQEPSIMEDNESVVDEYDAAQEAIRLEERQKALDAMEANKGQDDAIDDDDDISDMHTEDGFEDSVQVQEGDGYDSESGDSLYHDTVQTFMSHEDREDAFDYEHFFLHSALGNLSQQRRGSVSSESSVETTRGPMTSDESIRPRSHHRRGSGDTTSTIESFATARSGRGSRISTNDVSEDLRHGILTPPSVSPISEHTESPPTAKRSTIGSTMGGEDVLEELRTRARAGSTVYRRPMSTQATMGHRPSTASFDSTGTNRSFPLVGKARVSVGVLTPQGSPELELKTISDALMSETASICDKESMHTPDQLAPMEALAKEDQILVERFVASLGRCVLAMSEAGKASSESRMYRRRIDAARRILEGMGETS
ncbi:hypothetical protein CABS01_12507 [Colletotrichum abscissum]|uniref:Uncharacterized protein n=1 Tax=Colletotrichum abscissum TaxID=1671311 RepID=A0A9P9XAH8_9PEZI|nr:uncharacterized protein CABS01_12507 [Colletotrichum abscissum]KAI3544369.1 hypothetical protein CABS02_09771 [Colletotrichum abscissum]KAK1489926.1 hypothetical protein CABS01_12507 [Colletotrichum abscissum]